MGAGSGRSRKSSRLNRPSRRHCRACSGRLSRLLSIGPTTGRSLPDWDQVIAEVEESEAGLDLGTDMDSLVVKAILKEGRRLYREMRDDA